MRLMAFKIMLEPVLNWLIQQRSYRLVKDKGGILLHLLIGEPKHGDAFSLFQQTGAPHVLFGLSVVGAAVNLDSEFKMIKVKVGYKGNLIRNKEIVLGAVTNLVFRMKKLTDFKFKQPFRGGPSLTKNLACCDYLRPIAAGYANLFSRLHFSLTRMRMLRGGELSPRRLSSIVPKIP
jgi:hypothetical protein